MLKQLFVLFLLLAAVFAEKAYFTFETYDRSGEFVVELTTDELIKHARDLLSGETTDEPHIMGRIIKRTAQYNPRYEYYLDPESIRFFNHAIEVCDASFSYTEDHLDEACGAFLPGCYLCPWTSKIIREIDSRNAVSHQKSFRTGGKYWAADQLILD